MLRTNFNQPILFLFIGFLFLFSCSKDNLAPELESYLNVAIDSIQANALTSANLDWDVIRKEALRKAEGAKKTEDLYDVLAWVLGELNDNHSFLQKNSVNLSYPASTSEREPSPYGKRMKIEHGLHVIGDMTFARIFVPQGMRDNAFAQELQDRILELSNSNPCGWIVDLRGNGGGNMWPMLAGIGPLTGDNPLGGSRYASGEQDSYLYIEGKAIYKASDDIETLAAEAQEKIEPISDEVPVAVLIDRGTASSGEALAVIFKGKENTRLFGEPTYGASTGTRGIMLSDSLNLVIAVSTFQDRKGKQYLEGVQPDEELSVGTELLSPDEDPIVDAAISWLSDACNE